MAAMKRTAQSHRFPATSAISCAGYCFPTDVISYGAWLYYLPAEPTRGSMRHRWSIAAERAGFRRVVAGCPIVM